MKKICFLCLFLLSFGKIYSSEREDRTGSLIVSYRTDSKGERLERTRFWLKGQEGAFREFYPKGDSVVDNPDDHSRMVVIEALEPGTYTLQFLIPNRDHYFQEVPERNITIIAGEIVKLDQTIKRFLPIHKPIHSESIVIENSDLNSLEPGQEFEEKHEGLGALKLYVNVTWALGEIVSREMQGESISLELTQKETNLSLPSGDYVLLFHEAEQGSILPHPINFKIEPLQIKELNAYFVPRG